MDQTAFNSYSDDNQGTAKAEDGKTSSNFNFHKGLLVVILMIVWGSASYYYVVDIIAMHSKWMTLVSLPLFIVIAFTIAALIYSVSVKYPIKKAVKIKKLHWYHHITFSLASPSWYFARLFKNELISKLHSEKTRTNKDGLTVFISSINGTNLIVSAILAAIGFLMYNTWMADYIVTFVVLRTLSRSFEITLAFGDDAIDHKQKTSVLLHNQPLKLAFTSLY